MAKNTTLQLELMTSFIQRGWGGWGEKLVVLVVSMMQNREPQWALQQGEQ